MKAQPEIQVLLDSASKGDRRDLGKLLTAVERGGERAKTTASLAYRSKLEPKTVGITGAPGAGKSTLTGKLISVAIQRTEGPIGVLAVDPTSPFSGGAILGDRVRMQDHALDPRVFIRSMATRGHLGGLALAVPEAIRVMAAAKFPMVLVETVGVGQVEVEVASATDTTVVVVNPKWGDAIQANKAGLMEIADIFVINKADLPGARQSRRDLQNMLELSAPSDWTPPIVDTVASDGTGVESLWDEIEKHQQFLSDKGELDERRRRRLQRELRLVLSTEIHAEVDRLCSGEMFAKLVEDVMSHRIDPYTAAEALVHEINNPGDSSQSGLAAGA